MKLEQVQVESCFEYILIKWFILMNDAFAHCFLTQVKGHYKICSKVKLIPHGRKMENLFVSTW